MSTPKKTKAPAKPKVVKYESMRALKIAKSRKALPRGLVVCREIGNIKFVAPGQAEPIFVVEEDVYVAACLKADGFKLAGS